MRRWRAELMKAADVGDPTPVEARFAEKAFVQRGNTEGQPLDAHVARIRPFVGRTSTFAKTPFRIRMENQATENPY